MNHHQAVLDLQDYVFASDNDFPCHRKKRLKPF
jgi:hypothetical protein